MKNEIVLSAHGAESSAITTWLNRENQFFSSVLEEVVTNRQVCLIGHASFAFSAWVSALIVPPSLGEKKILKVCGLKKNTYLCNVVHLIRAERTANIAVGIFYAHGLQYSSVPCGALMRPLPLSGVRQRGAELFLFPSRNNQHIISF